MSGNINNSNVPNAFNALNSPFTAIGNQGNSKGAQIGAALVNGVASFGSALLKNKHEAQAMEDKLKLYEATQAYQTELNNRALTNRVDTLQNISQWREEEQQTAKDLMDQYVTGFNSPAVRNQFIAQATGAAAQYDTGNLQFGQQLFGQRAFSGAVQQVDDIKLRVYADPSATTYTEAIAQHQGLRATFTEFGGVVNGTAAFDKDTSEIAMAHFSSALKTITDPSQLRALASELPKPSKETLALVPSAADLALDDIQRLQDSMNKAAAQMEVAQNKEFIKSIEEQMGVDTGNFLIGNTDTRLGPNLVKQYLSAGGDEQKVKDYVFYASHGKMLAQVVESAKGMTPETAIVMLQKYNPATNKSLQGQELAQNTKIYDKMVEMVNGHFSILDKNPAGQLSGPALIKYYEDRGVAPHNQELLGPEQRAELVKKLSSIVDVNGKLNVRAISQLVTPEAYQTSADVRVAAKEAGLDQKQIEGISLIMSMAKPDGSNVDYINQAFNFDTKAFTLPATITPKQFSDAFQGDATIKQWRKVMANSPQFQDQFGPMSELIEKGAKLELTRNPTLSMKAAIGAAVKSILPYDAHKPSVLHDQYMLLPQGLKNPDKVARSFKLAADFVLDRPQDFYIETTGGTSQKPPTAFTSPKFFNSAKAREEHIKPMVQYAASVTGVPPQLIASVMASESSQSHLRADGSVKYSKDEEGNPIAYGIMQVTPATFKELAYKHNIKGKVTDYESNVLAGAYYLGDLLKQYKGNVLHAMIAYNGGPGGLFTWKSGNRASWVKDMEAYARGVKARVDAGKYENFSGQQIRLDGFRNTTTGGKVNFNNMMWMPSRTDANSQQLFVRITDKRGGTARLLPVKQTGGKPFIRVVKDD